MRAVSGARVALNIRSQRACHFYLFQPARILGGYVSRVRARLETTVSARRTPKTRTEHYTERSSGRLSALETVDTSRWGLWPPPLVRPVHLFRSSMGASRHLAYERPA
jgi:hypothetical protein